MRVLICGSRDWTDQLTIRMTIAGLETFLTALTIVHGACRGADTIADGIARSWGVTVEPHPADWKGKGKSAGFQRNKEMVDLGADLVIAFKDYFDHTLQTGGTESTISLARMAGIKTLVISH